MTGASTLPADPHPFDAALSLRPLADGQGFAVSTSETYWNLTGPFGGWMIAAGLKAVRAQQDAQGVPVEAHARFLAAPKPGELTIRVSCQQQGRSVGFWRALLSQGDGDDARNCCEVSVILAGARDTLDVVAAVMPEVPAPEESPAVSMREAPVRWIKQYDLRYISGWPFGRSPEPDARRLETRCWLRESRPRQLDWESLVALADSPVPRVFLLQGAPSPVATVSLSVYFHATQQEIEHPGPHWLLLDIHGHSARRGFFDHFASIWRDDGRLMATTTQLAWFA